MTEPQTTDTSAIKNPDELIIKSNFRTIWIGGIITTVTTGLLVFIVWLSGNWGNVLLRDYIAVFTGGVIATTLFYHAKNLRNNFDANQQRLAFERMLHQQDRKDKEVEAEKKRKIFASAICSWWFKPDMAPYVEQARCFLNKYENKLKDHHPFKEFILALDKNPTNRQALISILNLFEYIAIVIKYGLADEEILKKAFKTSFCDYYERLKRYIMWRRKKSPFYYINYEELAKKWEQG